MTVMDSRAKRSKSVARVMWPEHETLKENFMNTNRIAVSLTVLLLAVAPSLYATRCSNASLHGTYGYSSQGFASVTPDISPALCLPQVQTGLITFDGRE